MLYSVLWNALNCIETESVSIIYNSALSLCCIMKLSWDKSLQLCIDSAVQISYTSFLKWLKSPISKYLFQQQNGMMFHKLENPKEKKEYLHATRPQQTSVMLPINLQHQYCPKFLQHESWPWLQRNFENEQLSCGKSGEFLFSSGVRLGAVEEEMHQLSVQRKWGESG